MYRCYYPHRSRESVSPVCVIFTIESPCPSVVLCVCAIKCIFFRGLSLALRSHDQFQASYWSSLPPSFRTLETWRLGNLVTPKLGNSETQNLANSETLKLENSETRKLRNSRNRKLGKNLESQKLGNSETQKLGNLETGKPPPPKK